MTVVPKNKCIFTKRRLCCPFFMCYSQEQSGLVVNLLRQFQHLKLVLSAVVENAQTVAHNLPDHNHNAQEARKTFNRVSAFLVFTSLSIFLNVSLCSFV